MRSTFLSARIVTAPDGAKLQPISAHGFALIYAPEMEKAPEMERAYSVQEMRSILGIR